KLVFIDVAKATVRHSVDLAAGKYVRLAGNGLLSKGLTLSADGSTLAVHYSDYCVDVWDAKTNTVRYSCGGRQQVSLSPDARVVARANGGVNPKVRLGDGRARKDLEPLPIDPGSPRFGRGVTHAVAFSPDGKFLAVTGEAEVALYDLATRKQVQRLK